MGEVCADCICSREAERERVIRVGVVASSGAFLRFDRDEPSEPLSLSLLRAKSFSDCSCDEESRFKVSLTVLFEPLDATTFFVL